MLELKASEYLVTSLNLQTRQLDMLLADVDRLQCCAKSWQRELAHDFVFVKIRSQTGVLLCAAYLFVVELNLANGSLDLTGSVVVV